MWPPSFAPLAPRTRNCPRRVHLLLLILAAAVCLVSPLASPAQSNEILSLDQVRPGMHGYAYTIFAGDQIEKFDLEVIDVMPNFLGPRQSIILVQLKGPKVEIGRASCRERV